MSLSQLSFLPSLTPGHQKITLGPWPATCLLPSSEVAKLRGLRVIATVSSKDPCHPMCLEDLQNQMALGILGFSFFAKSGTWQEKAAVASAAGCLKTKVVVLFCDIHECNGICGLCEILGDGRVELLFHEDTVSF